MSNPGVIYLYRHAEGEAPARRFLDTYRAHPAGLTHDLYAIYKGFPDRAALDAGRALFAGVAHKAIELDDSGFDIGSYVAAAHQVDNRRIIFLNTFSQILGDDWLKLFDNALNEPGVGIVGATGSWQSNAASYERTLIRIVNNLRVRLGAKTRIGTGAGITRLEPLAMRPRPISRYVFGPFEYVHKVYEYGRHPNPHIRTNAFMVDRAEFLSLRLPAFKSKSEAYRFESGRLSLTRQYLARGLRTVVVDRNGAVYDIPHWYQSGTFWAGGQENLLIADNRTCDYSEGTPEMRRYLEHIAWIDPWASA